VATKNSTKSILLVDEKLRGMFKEEDKDFYIRNFGKNHKIECIEGAYKRGKPDGMTAQIEGVFTATDGRTFLVYVDWSVNSADEVDEKGFPKN
jgi:hypothetical protein